MKTALYIGVDGEEKVVTPKNGEDFTLEELQAYVGGNIEIVPFGEELEIIVNEEGKLIGLEKNEKATEIWNINYPIELYPDNNDQLIVGNVLIKKIDQYE